MVKYGRVPCAIFGSRGLVAQRLLQRLINHNWLEPVIVVGSPLSVGTNVNDLDWALDEEKPELPSITVKGFEDIDLLISEMKYRGVQIIFSALPNSIAVEVEEKIAKSGFFLISHAQIHRLKDHIPLVIPDVNPNQLNIIDLQNYGSGALISCCNCMAVPLAIAISPLYSKFDISSIKIITEQSLSGGGRDMLLSGKSGVHIDCEIPGEEKSIVNELTNIFASLNDDINQLKVPYIEAKCSRVMRDYGHLAIVEIDFSKDISAHSIINSWQEYIPLTKQLKLPSSPKQVIELIDGKLNTDVHRWAGSESRDPNTDLSSAMSVAVGEVEVKGNKLKFTLVSDNTIRGAAGYSVLLAELILADGILHDKNTILNSPI